MSSNFRQFFRTNSWLNLQIHLVYFVCCIHPMWWPKAVFYATQRGLCDIEWYLMNAVVFFVFTWNFPLANLLAKNILNIKISRHFCLSLSLECCGEISRQSAESAYPINSVKVYVFLPKSYARFSLVKVRKQLGPRLEIISPDKTANQWNNRTS